MNAHESLHDMYLQHVLLKRAAVSLRDLHQGFAVPVYYPYSTRQATAEEACCPRKAPHGPRVFVYPGTNTEFATAGCTPSSMGPW